MVSHRPLTYPAGKTGRNLRRPVYRFQLKTKPWQLQPFMIAPVLPGETLKNGLFQSRVISDPLKHRLLGAHKEYWFFYVRLRDLQGSADFEAMMLDLNKDMSSYRSAASVKYFHKYGINWTKLALDKIVEHYFRADDEIGSTFEIDGLPARSMLEQNWLDSFVGEDEFAPIADVNVDANADGNITVGEIDEAQRNFALMRQFGLTEMDFDDYLRTFGIRVAPAESDKPEMLRYSSTWQYPANTVEPTTGVPTTAWSASVSDRMDKDRFFKEPGFIIGITSFKPKVYLGNQTGSVTGIMDNAMRWLPRMMADDPYTSMVLLDQANKEKGPLTGLTDGYWFDLKDLFLYGEQYSNFAMTAADGAIGMPTASGQKRYPTLAMANSIFAAPSGGTLLEDGIVNLSIMGSQKDTTPSPSSIGI
nr:MAG: major capsid protein [Microvirus sp.]